MDDDEIEVPCHFLCPISMELMRDPVTVVSGITYDRHSIERWLSSTVKGEKNTTTATTCPVTKHDLADSSLTPNHTLRRLIHSWCDQHGVDIAERAPDPNPLSTHHQQQPRILELLRDAVASTTPELAAMHLRRIRVALSLGNDRTRKCLEESGAVEFLASVIKSRDFAACHAEAVSADSAADEALSVLYHVQASAALLGRVAGENGGLMESLLHALAHGKVQTRAYAVLLMRSVLEAADHPVRPVGATREVLSEVVRVVRDRISLQATRAALKVLVVASRLGRNRVKAVEAGAVHALVEVLLGACGSGEWRSCELALVGLDQLCSCAEGRAELLRHGAGVAVVTKKMLRVSAAATDRAVRVVSWICRLSATGRVLQEMLEVGAVTKLCLVLQVENGLKTKERSREILRLHAHAWRGSPCITPHLLSSYPPS